MIDLTDQYEKISDERGFIQDLAIETEIKAVTHIFSRTNSVRANHFHKYTEQYNYVAHGSLQLATRKDHSSRIELSLFKSNSFFLIEREEHHALKFTEDTLLIVFTIGPRAGKEYESDTYRLDQSLFELIK